MTTLNVISDRIFTINDFFTPDECDASIALAESAGFEEAPINTAYGPQVHKRVRNNTRVIMDDRLRAATLWDRIAGYIPKQAGKWTACGVNERFRFYRYDVGQRFNWHYDGYYQRDNGERSRLTFMVYLNDEFEGGETTIEKLDVQPEKGLALLFFHHVRHKGQPVVRGRKYVLRTDVMYQLTEPMEE